MKIKYFKMLHILKLIQESSFKKESADSSFKIELSTLYGILKISIALDNDIENALFITVSHKTIKNSLYAASVTVDNDSQLEDIIKSSIIAFFEEITNSYIERYLVQ